ncbi:hypothetical protein [Kutzneria sp. NPDC052558]|uniref:hypothetical protein n=1 Tax=Kutzneria sp. NPDC052558 TaxID=3364121 RepID=UPI0037CAB482
MPGPDAARADHVDDNIGIANHYCDTDGDEHHHHHNHNAATDDNFRCHDYDYDNRIDDVNE